MTNGGAASLGARTARACDGCMRRRARWHCAADDAYLCQACDASVHSANALARRHHRVRLPSASSSSSTAATSSLPRVDPDEPAWLHGLKRRPRTPRSKPGMTSKQAARAATLAAVPDLEAEDSGSGIVGENDDARGQEEVYDEDLLYQVPVFDPMLAELYNPVPAEEDAEHLEQKPPACCFASLADQQPPSECASGMVDGFSGFDVVPDMELASFAADMESLLMGGVDEGFDDLRFLDEEKPQMNLDFDMDFDDQTVAPVPELQHEDRKRKRSDSEMILKLDYEGVIDSWSRDGGSPWFHGERPHFDPSDSWLDITVSCAPLF
jgi:hypothetical protein